MNSLEFHIKSALPLICSDKKINILKSSLCRNLKLSAFSELGLYLLVFSQAAVKLLDFQLKTMEI